MKSYYMPLPVQLLAMSQSSQKNISGFIKTKGKTHFTLSDSQTAQAVILDIDNQEGRDLLLDFQTNRIQANKEHSRNIQIIALSLSPLDNLDSSIIQIKKPITGIELIRAAEKIKKMSNNKHTTSAKPESKVEHKLSASHSTDKSKTYEPSGTLQGMLRRAIQLSDKEKTPVVLHVQDYCIEINVATNQALLNFPKNRLRSLCYVPLNASVCHIEKGSLGSSSIDRTPLPIAELSWNTALLCSRGRSPINLNDDSIYQLKRWPNLTRWTVPNNALSIASLWTKYPCSITAIAQQLNIPIIDVRSFITAALDSHLAIMNEEVSEIIPFKAKKKDSTLFKKLLNRLKRG